MKKILLFIVILLAAFSVYWFVLKSKPGRPKDPKQPAIGLKKHSEDFNQRVDNAMTAYLNMKDAFVDSDTSKAKTAARSFISLLDSIPLDELKKDTAGIFETAQATVNDIKANTESLIQQTDLTEMRKDFSMLTEMLYPSFFSAINYEQHNLYLQNCPMAFNDEISANWISNSKEVVNPYLGKNHPKYKAGMLHCGEVKDTIKAQ